MCSRQNILYCWDTHVLLSKIFCNQKEFSWYCHILFPRGRARVNQICCFLLSSPWLFSLKLRNLSIFGPNQIYLHHYTGFFAIWKMIESQVISYTLNCVQQPNSLIFFQMEAKYVWPIPGPPWRLVNIVAKIISDCREPKSTKNATLELTMNAKEFILKPLKQS